MKGDRPIPVANQEPHLNCRADQQWAFVRTDSVQRSQVENDPQDVAEDSQAAADSDSILVATVIAVLVSSTETLAEVVVVLVPVDVKRCNRAVGILVRVRGLVIDRQWSARSACPASKPWS